MVRPYVRRWKFVNHLPPRKTSAHEVFGWIVVRLVFLTTAMICLEDPLSLVLCPSGSWLCSWWASVLWAVLSLMHITWGCFLQAWMVAFLRDPSGHKDHRLQTSLCTGATLPRHPCMSFTVGWTGDSSVCCLQQQGPRYWSLHPSGSQAWFFFYFGCLVWFWFSGVFCLVGCFYFSKQGFSEPWRSSIDQAGLNRDTPPSAGNKDMFHHPAKVKTLNIKTEKFRTNQYEAKLEFIIQFIRFKHKGL